VLSLSFFDKDNSGTIDSNEFMIGFFKLGSERKKDEHAAELQLRTASRKSRKTAEEKRLHDLEWRVGAVVDLVRSRMSVCACACTLELTVTVLQSFTDEEMKAAINKVQEKAADYCRYDSCSPSTRGLECTTLTPGVFKEMLKRTFDITLNTRELGALARCRCKLIIDDITKCVLDVFSEFGYTPANPVVDGERFLVRCVAQPSRVVCLSHTSADSINWGSNIAQSRS
jgi:hypothetical protein